MGHGLLQTHGDTDQQHRDRQTLEHRMKRAAHRRRPFATRRNRRAAIHGARLRVPFAHQRRSPSPAT